MLMIGTGAILQSDLHADSAGWSLLPGLIVAGAGVGLATAALISHTMAAVPSGPAGSRPAPSTPPASLASRSASRSSAACTGRLASHLAAAATGPERWPRRWRAGRPAPCWPIHPPRPGQRRGGGPRRISVGLHIGLLVAGGLGLVGGMVALAALKRHPAAGPAAGQIPASQAVPEPGGTALTCGVMI